MGAGFDMATKFAHSERSFKCFVRSQRDDRLSPISHPANMSEAGWYLREWRKHRGLSQEALAEGAGTSKGYVSDLESGKRPVPPGRLVERLASALDAQVSDLFRHPEAAAVTPLVPIIGRVGADNEGEVIYTTGQETWDMAPVPPGGSPDSVALEVRGHSMRALADDGALLYFERQHTPPTPDMLGYPCIVETEDGRVLLKRLLKGSAPNLYDLESQNGPTLEDVRLRWAAEITAIIPARAARRIIRRRGEAA